MSQSTQHWLGLHPEHSPNVRRYVQRNPNRSVLVLFIAGSVVWRPLLLTPDRLQLPHNMFQQDRLQYRRHERLHVCIYIEIIEWLY